MGSGHDQLDELDRIYWTCL